MSSVRYIVLAMAGLGAGYAAHASQTVSYVYDALGRLTEMQVLSGPGSGVKQAYGYDAAGNRTQYQVTAPGQSPITLTVPNPNVNITSAGATLTVSVSGSSPGGTVTFTENGAFIGIAQVVGGQASITVEGLTNGAHSILATYSGDGSYAPQAMAFNITIRNLLWLPAVLQILLSD